MQVLNGLKMSLSTFGHAVERAVSDGHINAIESLGLIAQGGNLGLSFYGTFVGLKDDISSLLSTLDRARFTLE